MTKKAVVLILSVVIVPAGLAAVLIAAPDTPDENPELYFTRLAYTETGERGIGSHAPGFRCPEFGGGNFFPRQSMGWGMDYPGADCKFMGGIHRLTGLSVSPNPNVLEITDDELFNYPYAYIVEPGGMDLTQEEAVRLREYLLRGGFIHVDDFWGLYELRNFETQMAKVFPDRELEVLSLSNPVFKTFFNIDSVILVPGRGRGCDPGGIAFGAESADDTEPRIYGVSNDDGRLMVVVTYNSDLGDAWEYMDDPCYSTKFSGQAYRLGMNFMIYATTH
jgi:hypothetical protein